MDASLPSLVDASLPSLVDASLPSLAAVLPVERSHDPAPLPGLEATSLREEDLEEEPPSQPSVPSVPSVRSAPSLSVPSLAAGFGDVMGDPDEEEDTERDPTLPRQRPEAEHLPIALDDLNAQLEQLNQRAQDVIERLAAGLVGEESLESGDVTAKDSALEAAAALIQEQLGSAQEASQSAKQNLDAAEEHRTARRVDLLDVTSHALGIGAALDLFTVLIPHNTAVPVERTRIFTTNQDGQSEVQIRVYQGRQQRASQNQPLGAFILEGIPPAPRMSPKIEVTFSIDADGILSVRARDAQTLREQSIRVEDPLGLQHTEQS
jgi:hypothetical protein